MRMTDALGALNITHKNEITLDLVKMAYRQQSKKFHPDLNPAGIEVMKLINAAFERLKTCRFPIKLKEGDEIKTAFGDLVNAALNAIINFPNLEIEVCGSWIWVGGNTIEVKEHLKTAGFRYASKKQKWYFCPEGGGKKRGNNWSMNKIRETFGSKAVKTEERTKVAA